MFHEEGSVSWRGYVVPATWAFISAMVAHGPLLTGVAIVSASFPGAWQRITACLQPIAQPFPLPRVPLNASPSCFATRASREESPSLRGERYRRPPTAALLLRPHQTHRPSHQAYLGTYISTTIPLQTTLFPLAFAQTSVCARPKMFCDMLLMSGKLSCRRPDMSPY